MLSLDFVSRAFGVRHEMRDTLHDTFCSLGKGLLFQFARWTTARGLITHRRLLQGQGNRDSLSLLVLSWLSALLSHRRQNQSGHHQATIFSRISDGQGFIGHSLSCVLLSRCWSVTG